MKTINFNDCTLDFLDTQFNLLPAISLPILQSWVNTSISLSVEDVYMIQKSTNNLRLNAAHWNEQDLSLHFIGPMFAWVGFTEILRFNIFTQVNMEAMIDNIVLLGRVDELIATGFRSPKIPFFAFNEYKRGQDYKGDALGQALAAMLVGQCLNTDGKPIYGCCVIGQNWYFMTLEAKQYAISSTFDGTNFEDACQILRILYQLKQYCMERTEGMGM